ncbi:aromatic acid exporter family protein [Mumia zhuanghuii]|uniref:Aromatic acid exporter family protein n=2 Tax=Mumia TaxID=1546255 RepID=A0ABW1QKD2_9ACTN|nr:MULTISPECIES: FUSC family protein [Mumia]KAA1418345.1 aromatic acid exporter family protein [Mumia zhuanghuii]
MAREEGFLQRIAGRPDVRGGRVPVSLHTRIAWVRSQWTAIVQISLGAAIAWVIAHTVIGHEQPFFAPVAAILVIFAGAGGRRQNTIELFFGVSVGVLIGEGLILVIGRGWWQIGVIVALAAMAATFLGMRGLARTQAATSASLLAAIVPVTSGNPAVVRFVDAVVGGLVGLAMALLIPGNPARRANRDMQVVLGSLDEALRQIETALRLGDAGPAWTALQQLRAAQPAITGLETTVANADEIARYSPLRWGQRGHVERYVIAIRDVDNAIRDTRVLARRVHTMLRRGERAFPGIPEAVGLLQLSVGVFADDIAAEDAYDEARRQLIDAAKLATRALPDAATINDAAVVAQVRAIASDLLYATGWTVAQVDRAMGSAQ